MGFRRRVFVKFASAWNGNRRLDGFRQDSGIGEMNRSWLRPGITHIPGLAGEVCSATPTAFHVFFLDTSPGVMACAAS